MKGVYFDNHMQRWMGRMQYKGKVYRKGFIEKDDAIKYRKELEEMLLPKTVKLDEPRGLRATTMVYDEVATIDPKVVQAVFVTPVRPKNFCLVNESFEMEYAPQSQLFTKTNLKNGEFECGSFRKQGIKFKLIYNENATIVILEDGTKGVAMCGKDDIFSRKQGLEYAFGRAYGQYLLNKYSK